MPITGQKPSAWSAATKSAVQTACDILTVTNATTTYNAKALQVGSITLSQGSWSLVSGLYEYDLANANITSTSIVDVIPDNADIAIVQAAVMLPKTVSSAGSVKLYATNAPTDDIGITINIW